MLSWYCDRTYPVFTESKGLYKRYHKWAVAFENPAWDSKLSKQRQAFAGGVYTYQYNSEQI